MKMSIKDPSFLKKKYKIQEVSSNYVELYIEDRKWSFDIFEFYLEITINLNKINGNLLFFYLKMGINK